MEDPRTVITPRYNDYGGNLDGLESIQPDHMKVPCGST
jgi:hypothetical protein